MEQSMVFTTPKKPATEYDKAYLWGEYFHVVTLKDGRDIGISADKLLVTDNGDLLAMSTKFLVETTMERKTLSSPKTILALAKGEWISFYSASSVTGDPLGVEWFEPVD